MTGSSVGAIVVNDESDEDIAFDRVPAYTGEDFEEIERPDGQEFRGNGGNALDDDDKKKLGFKTRYEGFSIWGRVLCLIVERKSGPGKKEAGNNAQALMQGWIASTQQGQDDDA